MDIKSPAVLVYTGDFLTGTTFMTNEQVGAYTRLLFYQHQLGHLKKEYMANITNDEIVLSKFIQDKDGLFYNERMEEEIKKRNNYSLSRSKNRSKSKSKPRKHMINISNSYEEHMDNDNDNDNVNIYINNLEDKGCGEKKPLKRYFEDKELNELFIEFLKLRKKLKAENTERAIKLLTNKLDKYDDDTKIKMIEQSIENSWKGLFEVKQKNNEPKKYSKEWLEQI